MAIKCNANRNRKSELPFGGLIIWLVSISEKEEKKRTALCFNNNKTNVLKVIPLFLLGPFLKRTTLLTAMLVTTFHIGYLL